MKGPLSQLFGVLFVGVFVLQGCSSNSKDRGDVRPDEFTVTSTQTEVEPNALVESQPFTVTGINREAKVTLSSDEIADLKFTVNGGEPKESGSTVRNGDEVIILGTSPAAYGANASINVNIGGVESEFAVSTGDDETPPEVSILFPPPSTMTEGETVFVRGTVEDLYGEVSTLLVNGVEVDITEGLPEWSAEVSLNEGENTLTVTATDVSGNENNDHSVSVRRDPEGGAFPDNENPSSAIGFSGSLVVRDQKELYVIPDYADGMVFSIDLSSGSKEVLSSGDEGDLVPFNRLQYLVTAGNRAFVASYRNSIFELDLETGDKTVLDGIPGSVEAPRALLVGEGEDRNILYFTSDSKLYVLDLDDNSVELIMDGADIAENPIDDNIISIGAFEGDASGLYLLTFSSIYRFDVGTGNAAIVYSHESDRSFWDLDLGEHGEVFIADNTSSDPVVWYIDNEMTEARSISSSSYPSSVNSFESLTGIDCLTGRGFCLLVDPTLNTVFAMDKVFGHRVVLTRSVQE